MRLRCISPGALCDFHADGGLANQPCPGTCDHCAGDGEFEIDDAFLCRSCAGVVLLGGTVEEAARLLHEAVAGTMDRSEALGWIRRYVEKHGEIKT